MTGLISPIGIGTAIAYPKQTTAGAPLDPLVDPGYTNPPILFEPPPGLTAGGTEVWIIATGGADWGGCQVCVSLDGTTYAYAFVTLCYCDGELIAFKTATLTASHRYDLTYLRRGVYGTPIGAHSAGASFAR